MLRLSAIIHEYSLSIRPADLWQLVINAPTTSLLSVLTVEKARTETAEILGEALDRCNSRVITHPWEARRVWFICIDPLCYKSRCCFTPSALHPRFQASVFVCARLVGQAFVFACHADHLTDLRRRKRLPTNPIHETAETARHDRDPPLVRTRERGLRPL